MFGFLQRFGCDSQARWRGTRSSTSYNSYHRPQVAMMPAVPVPSTCTPAFDGGIPSSGPWTAVYRLAYEQARAALAPSRFQEMIQPTWN